MTEMANMTEENTLSETRRWFKALVEAGEAALAAAEDCLLDSNPGSGVLLLVNSQRELVRGDVVKFRAKLASFNAPKQIEPERRYAVTFDHRYWKPGTFVYPMHVFLDPAHRFSAQQARRIQALKIGETVDLADGRVVQRQQ